MGRGGVAVLAAALAMASPAHAADAVTEWTLEADTLGQGSANWHTLAIMHQAMHDAVNAIQPTYARWNPAEPNEPPAEGASLPAAMAAAAAQVLVDLHPTQRADVEDLLQTAMQRLPDDPATQAGSALGRAVGRAAIARRTRDGYTSVHAFKGTDAPGQWRPVPPLFATSNTTDARPFIMPARDWDGATPPPPADSPVFQRDRDEIRRLGAAMGSDRTASQTDAALYWAYQSSQRGFVRLAVALLDSDPLPGGLVDHARAMSQLTVALADAAILTWAEKERMHAWRPITVIQGGLSGDAPAPNWQSLVETPPHPEYPSGHAADCYTSATVLSAVFGPDLTPVDYVALSGRPQGETAAIGMGQHAQVGDLTEVERHFPSFAAAAAECANSRIWAGAHFRYANEESHRLGDAIAARALAAVPRLPAAVR